MTETISDFRLRTGDAYNDMSDSEIVARLYKKNSPRSSIEAYAKQMGVEDLDIPWGTVLEGLVFNAPESAGQYAKDVTALIHSPVETVEGLKMLGSGIVDLLTGDKTTDAAAAREVGQFFVNRYGSVERAKNTLMTDPVGFLADVSTIFTGGAAGLRAAQLSGKTQRILAKVARLTDPTALTAKIASGAASKVFAPLSGTATGVGVDALREAYRTGLMGGELGDMFRSAMRGKSDLTEVVTMAENALHKLRSLQLQKYGDDIRPILDDPTPLDFGPVMDVIDELRGRGVGPGGIQIQPSTVKMVNKLEDAVLEFVTSNDPAAKTVKGMDALKKKIGDLYNKVSAKDRGAQKGAIDMVYHAVRKQITEQAPDYGRVMQEFMEADDLITEVRGTLSVNPKASVDTKLRKLQSALRNNVNTTFGRRTDLVKTLSDVPGSEGLYPSLAGQTVSASMGRGQAPVAMLPTTAVLSSVMDPTSVAGMATAGAGLAAQSPRVAGEVAHAAGRIARRAAPVANMAQNALPVMYQAGRPPGLLEEQY